MSPLSVQRSIGEKANAPIGENSSAKTKIRISQSKTFLFAKLNMGIVYLRGRLRAMTKMLFVRRAEVSSLVKLSRSGTRVRPRRSAKETDPWPSRRIATCRASQNRRRVRAFTSTLPTARRSFPVALPDSVRKGNRGMISSPQRSGKIIGRRVSFTLTIRPPSGSEFN